MSNVENSNECVSVQKLVESAVKSTITDHPIATSSKIHRETLSKYLNELLPDHINYFALVAKYSVGGEETWNWAQRGSTAYYYYKNKNHSHKYIVYAS